MSQNTSEINHTFVVKALNVARASLAILFATAEVRFAAGDAIK